MKRSNWLPATRAAWLFLVALAVLVVLGAGCVVYRSKGEPMRSAGEPEIGVSYRERVSCPRPIEIGDSRWVWAPFDEWPPPEPGENGEPYAVRGIITIESERTATFRVDVDGSEYALIRDDNAEPDFCL
jgi:hypothetical protein